jgi:hypothetical protein
MDFESGSRRPRYGTITACLRAFHNSGVVFFVADDGAACAITKEVVLQLACAHGHDTTSTSLR